MSYSIEDEEKYNAIFEAAKKSANSGNDVNVSSRNIRRKQAKETFSERLKRQQRENNLKTLNRC
ncbi:hypothetical protein UFOVP129_7 [uncultured Caudovirales phage]|uniref:Uncharacterized protein n=1 Tax=uncultured Caudovirales phage TaxID=2100421 RepID=A0A6J5L7J8_9CAUD|nr:hypothetical protein UFOVP129_7 [uncultured Caudovirales phage]